MAVLKYERFIVKMSMEQKIRLITSSEFYKSNSVGGYEFPVFEIRKQPYDEDCSGLHVTHFPCDTALAAAWNPELTAEVYNAVGEETHAVNSFAYFNCTNDLKAEDIAAEHFALGKFLGAKIAGLRRGNGYVNFIDVLTEDEDESQHRREVRDLVLNASSPSSVVLSDLDALDVVKKRFKYGDLVYGVASTLEEALDYLYSGASFLFLAEDIFDKLVNKLTALTKAYRQAHAKYAEDRMGEAAFARLVRNFKVFNGEIIDKACDDIIDILFTMRSAKDEAKPEYRSLKKGEQAYFDEINHNELALLAARQSAVLIKNEGGVLPVNRSVKLGVIGEFAKDVTYQRGYHNTRSTAEKLPFVAINDYELNTTGFAMGYAKGEFGRSDLLDHALSVADKSDCVLLYLAADKGATELPREQLDVLNAIATRRAKIVAIVASEGNIDMSFADKCAAVLLTYVSGQGGTVAALDIITGLTCPSGKLAMPAGYYRNGSFIEVYPVGFGLSYTQFTYENLKVNESGVSFTVKNTGGCDGYTVPRLYVRKKNTSSVFKEKQFKGFTKVFVQKGDAVRVKIPFDDLTFSQYSPEKGYRVEGGLYTVTVGDSVNDEKLSGILLLKDYEEKFSYKNTVVQTAGEGQTVEFSESDLPADVKLARKKLPFALKITLAILLALYVDGILAIFAFGNVVGQKGVVFYVILGVVALIVNALVIAFICVAAKRRKSEKYLHKNVVLTEMLENVDEFAEIAKIKYKLPVDEPKPEETEEAEAEETTEEEAATQELAATYEVRFDDAEVTEVARGQKVSFAELCNNLRLFALKKGINLEMQSARVITSAIASCKVVFLTSKNAELLPAFVKVLNEYYGNDTPVVASDEWHTVSDLLWEERGDGKYVLSAFSNAVYGAHKAREQERVLLIDNVNISNLGSYFCNFLEYANHPTEEFVINFNDEISFRLPDNLTYVLVAHGGIEGLPAEMLNASMIAEVMLSRADIPHEEEIIPRIVSHEDFLLLLSEVKEEFFVTERIWKKVDALAETLAENERFEIGNKNTIQMESFTSVLMSCGADEPEAVTNMFLSKLAYILKNTRTYRQNGGEKTVFGIIEKLFADEELTKIKRALNKSASAAAPAQPAAGATSSTAQTAPAAQDAPAQNEEIEGGEQPAIDETVGQSSAEQPAVGETVGQSNAETAPAQDVAQPAETQTEQPEQPAAEQTEQPAAGGDGTGEEV